MPVSPLFDAWRPQLLEAARLGPLADVACGRGRHALACAAMGAPTLALDRNPSHLRELLGGAESDRAALLAVCADLEAGHEIPIMPGSCGAVLVFRFLFRPLMPALAALLAPGGLLVYETFTTGQRELGFGPKRDAFLLEPGELPGLFPGLDVLAFEEGLTDEPRPSHSARLVARRPHA